MDSWLRGRTAIAEVVGRGTASAAKPSPRGFAKKALLGETFRGRVTP
jgi:hypothetical protein